MLKFLLIKLAPSLVKELRVEGYEEARADYQRWKAFKGDTLAFHYKGKMLRDVS